MLGFIVPPTWLFNINTSRWLYRAQLNVFGTILAVCALDRWTSSQDRVPLRTAIVVAQLCWIVVTVAPVWYSIVRVAVGLQPPHRNALISPGIANRSQRARVAAGRVIFAPKAEAALRLPSFNSAGLAVKRIACAGGPDDIGSRLWHYDR